ncbi:MAG: hypothetical protein ACI4MH_05725 [Candidatus Coproplasma sp.]
MIKPEQNTQTFTRKIADISSQAVAESRFPQSNDVIEVLAVYPQVSLLSCEVSSGRVNYGGRIVFSVVYADEEGKLCRMQKGAEFNCFADDERLAPAQTAICNLRCERTAVRRDGSSFVLSAIICAEISVFAPCERTFITSCEGAFLKTEPHEFYSAVPFSGESEVEDDFDADSVADVLIPAARALVTGAECGTGEIIISGEIYLSLFAMRKDVPVSLDRVITFKSSIPCESSSVGSTPLVHAEIKDLSVTATVNEDKGKCRVSFVGSLAFSGIFYEKSEYIVAVDGFSSTNRLNLSTCEESAETVKESRNFSERVSGAASVKSRIDFTCRFLAAALPKVDYEYVQASGAIEGAVSAILFYEQSGEVKSSEVTLPFAVKLSAPSEGKVIADVAVCGVSLRQPKEGEVEGEAVLKISATVISSDSVRFIEGAEEGEAIPACESAVSVYIPCEGDGLWEVSKKLMRAPDEVSECNPDLKYPLTGSERIVIYRPKKVEA